MAYSGLITDGLGTDFLIIEGLLSYGIFGDLVKMYLSVEETIKQSFTIEGDNMLGTNKTIKTQLDETSPDSVKITITDPAGIEKVSAVNMTDGGSGLFSYEYQSAITDTAGKYCAVTTVVMGTKTSKSEVYFTLEAKCDG